MYILGISAFYHDSAAALIHNGEIIAAAQEERFTRKKNDESFPGNAIKCCLDLAGITLSDVETVVFYEKPFIKFERIVQSYYEAAPVGLVSFLKAMPIWLKDKLFLKKKIKEYLAGIPGYDKLKTRITFSEHHLSHAASAFYPSGFREAAIVTVDGVGEWATCTISYGKENNIKILKQLNFPHSVGLLYSAFTYFCGFRVNMDEYKLMGLAAYGNEEDKEYLEFKKIIETELIHVFTDGSIFLHPQYFAFTSSLRMVKDAVWEKLFGIKRRKEGEPVTQSYCNMALAVQRVTEQIMLLLAKEAKRLTGADTLCLAGGVALNCVANGKIADTGIFKNIFIQPASNDAGGALGAALAIWHIQQGNPLKKEPLQSDNMKNSLLGSEYNDKEVAMAAKKFNLKYEKLEEEILYDRVAKLIQQGKTIAWYQGRMEFGPRALGNRSILADARNETMQNELNLKIKFRENFRPFAPVILEEEAAKYFDIKIPSPYMLLAVNLKREFRIPYPAEAVKWGITERLNFKRSFVPAVTHIDYTARLQTVNEKTNDKLFKLLRAFFSDTGCPMLINTSFNTYDEPIVNSPADAFRCFTKTNIDYFVINNFVYQKN